MVVILLYSMIVFNFTDSGLSFEAYFIIFTAWSKECDLGLESIDLLHTFFPLKQTEIKTNSFSIAQSFQYIQAGSTFSSTIRRKLPSTDFSNFCSSSKVNPCRSSPLMRLSSMDHYMSQHCIQECSSMVSAIISPVNLPQFAVFLCYFFDHHGIQAIIKLKGQKNIAFVNAKTYYII